MVSMLLRCSLLEAEAAVEERPHSVVMPLEVEAVEPFSSVS